MPLSLIVNRHFHLAVYVSNTNIPLLSNGSPFNLAYVLADAGYDVWLSNARGNTYSRQHIKKNPNIPYSGFWNFSWYEHGIYDYPAVIDYVREQTNNTKVYV